MWPFSFRRSHCFSMATASSNNCVWDILQARKAASRAVSLALIAFHQYHTSRTNKAIRIYSAMLASVPVFCGSASKPGRRDWNGISAICVGSSPRYRRRAMSSQGTERGLLSRWPQASCVSRRTRARPFSGLLNSNSSALCEHAMGLPYKLPCIT